MQSQSPNSVNISYGKGGNIRLLRYVAAFLLVVAIAGSVLLKLATIAALISMKSGIGWFRDSLWINHLIPLLLIALPLGLISGFYFWFLDHLIKTGRANWFLKTHTSSKSAE